MISFRKRVSLSGIFPPSSTPRIISREVAMAEHAKEARPMLALDSIAGALIAHVREWVTSGRERPVASP